ncbi:MAG: hypothetical protein ACP5C3_04250 [Methanomicrobiales archaeon]
MKITSIGADISINDVSCSPNLIRNIENDIPQLMKKGAYSAALTNITGDDLVISAFVDDDNLEVVNKGIMDILEKNAEDMGDISGVSVEPENAGEGISYVEAKINQDFFPDAIIIAFDTYGGESFVNKVAESAIQAASSMDNVTDVQGSVVKGIKKIPGIGYVSDMTDDPVVVATVENIESVGVVAGAMVGASLGNKNVYLVKRGSPSHIIPGSVIMSVSAYMNGNVIDLAVPIEQRNRILNL